jgi:replicative DNA helicase
MSVATSLLACLVDSKDGMDQFLHLGWDPEYFRGPEEEGCWSLMVSYITKYGVMPSRERFLEEGFTLPLQNPDPLQYYYDKVKERFRHQTLKAAMLKASDLLKNEKIDEAEQALMETSLKLLKGKNKKQIVNFAQEGHDIVFNEIKAKKLAGDAYGMKTGWPSLDNLCDGLQGGDVMAVIGRPGQGKTYALLQAASHGWMHQDEIPLLISMEMKPTPIIQRLAAINGKKSITQIKKAELSTAAEKGLAASLISYKSKLPFHVVDGALSSTMADILLLAQMLKPTCVWIDGAYLVKSPNPKQPRWERVTEVIETAKTMAEALELPTVVSFQFNREHKKGGGDKDVALANIAGADAVGQICSVVLGLGLSGDEQSPEQLYRRQIDILKGRNGEVGSFLINWRFDQGPDYMNFSEVLAPSKEDLTFGMA